MFPLASTDPVRIYRYRDGLYAADLLTLCAANGLVDAQDGRFAVTDMAREHRTKGSPFYLAPYYASLEDRPVVRDFVRVLRTGRPAHWGGHEEGVDWHTATCDVHLFRYN